MPNLVQYVAQKQTFKLFIYALKNLDKHKGLRGFAVFYIRCWLGVALFAVVLATLTALVLGRLPSDMEHNFIFAILLVAATGRTGYALFRPQKHPAGLAVPGSDASAVAIEVYYRCSFWIALLLHRLGSEIAIERQNASPQDVETRRLVLGVLRQRGVWEEMPEPVRDLFLKADGFWTSPEKEQVFSLFEYLYCMRWLTQLDLTMPLLNFAPEYSFQHTHAILQDREWLDRTKILPSWEIRPARDRARSHFNRLVIEAGVRGWLSVPDEEVASMRTSHEKILAAGAKGDFQVEGKAIFELEPQMLKSLYTRDLNRWQLLHAAVEDLGIEGSGRHLQELLAQRLAVLPAPE